MTKGILIKACLGGGLQKNPENKNLSLKLNDMQLVTPGGNLFCLVANDVQNSRLVHSFINIKYCIYINEINRKQLYTNQTSSRCKKVNKMRHFTVIVDLNVAQKKNLAW